MSNCIGVNSAIIHLPISIVLMPTSLPISIPLPLSFTFPISLSFPLSLPLPFSLFFSCSFLLLGLFLLIWSLLIIFVFEAVEMSKRHFAGIQASQPSEIFRIIELSELLIGPKLSIVHDKHSSTIFLDVSALFAFMTLYSICPAFLNILSMLPVQHVPAHYNENMLEHYNRGDDGFQGNTCTLFFLSLTNSFSRCAPSFRIGNTLLRFCPLFEG